MKNPLTGSFGSTPSEVEKDLASLREASGGKSSRQLEMEKLERWLQMGSDDEEGGGTSDLFSKGIGSSQTPTADADDPWSTASNSLNPKQDFSQSVGFDDDFSEFVSAPPLTTYMSSGHIHGASGEDIFELPSEVDIKDTAARIFGPPGSSSDVATSSQLSSSLPATSQSSVPDSSFLDTMKSFDTELDMDAAPFDLSRVLSALEGMKEEVALISDKAEREKAAARVALALVYGLEDVHGYGLDVDHDNDPGSNDLGRPE